MLEACMVSATYSSSQGITRYKVDLVVVQEVRWDKGGTVRQGIAFFLWKETKIINCKQDVLYTTEYCQKLRE
jgi:hypothetical protein